MLVQTIADLKNISTPSSTEIYTVLGYYSPGDGGGGDFYWDDVSTETDNRGIIFQPIAGGAGRWKRLTNETVFYAKWWGLHLDGLTDDSGFIQTACDYISSIGGGKLELPIGRMWFQFPVFVTNNIEIVGQGIGTHLISNRDGGTGRAIWLVGNSYEINRQTCDIRRSSNNTTGDLVNGNYTDTSFGTFLTEDGSTHVIEAQNSQIHNMVLEFNYETINGAPHPTDPWGGYGVQFAHAYNCCAYDIWTINACQAFGVGSDVHPFTPSCLKIQLENFVVLSPDAVHTYYALGFIANSQDVTCKNMRSMTPMTSGSDDGSLISTSLAVNCQFEDIVGNVGDTTTSEGLLLHDTYNVRANNITIFNAKSAVSCYDTYNLTPSPTAMDYISNVVAINCTVGLNILNKQSTFINCKTINCVTDISFANVNCQFNYFNNCSNENIVYPAGWTAKDALDNKNCFSKQNLNFSNYQSIFINSCDLVFPYNNDKVMSTSLSATTLNGNGDFVSYIDLGKYGINSFYGGTLNFTASSTYSIGNIVSIALLKSVTFGNNNSDAVNFTTIGTTTFTVPSITVDTDYSLNLSGLIANATFDVTSNVVLKITVTGASNLYFVLKRLFIDAISN